MIEKIAPILDNNVEDGEHKQDILPVVGQIIMSDSFRFGTRDTSGTIWITPTQEKDRVLTHRIPEDERVETAAKTGDILPKHFDVDMSADDETRDKAKFVVERAEMEGGSMGVGMNGHDDYPDGWHIRARRLSDVDGTYDPKGEVIDFYMSGAFTNKVNPDSVKIVGKDEPKFNEV